MCDIPVDIFMVYGWCGATGEILRYTWKKAETAEIKWWQVRDNPDLFADNREFCRLVNEFF